MAGASALLSQLRGRLESSSAHNMKTSRARFAEVIGRLESLSPLGVLPPGYSVTRLPPGAAVRVRLVHIVDQLEVGYLPLESSLKVFEEGVALARRCAKYLEEAEKRIELLTKDESGLLKIELFE